MYQYQFFGGPHDGGSIEIDELLDFVSFDVDYNRRDISIAEFKVSKKHRVYHYHQVDVKGSIVSMRYDGIIILEIEDDKHK